MLNIPEECRFRVNNMGELGAVLSVLESNGYHWNGGTLPTKLAQFSAYGLHIYKGHMIMRSIDRDSYDAEPVFPEIDINCILNGDFSASVSQTIFTLF